MKLSASPELAAERRLAILTVLRHLLMSATARGHSALVVALYGQIREEEERRW